MKLNRSVLVLGVLSLLVAITGCDTDVEGDEPGECSDGADNDRDGAFDCDDSNCAGAPACTPGSTSGPAATTRPESTPALPAEKPAATPPPPTHAPSAKPKIVSDSSRPGHPAFESPLWPGDLVDEPSLTTAGWTCALNEIGNRACYRQPSKAGPTKWTIQYMLDGDSVSRIGLSGGQLDDPAGTLRELTRQMRELARAHGWACKARGDRGDFVCTRGGRSFQGSSSADRGYAAVYVEDDAEHVMND
jgi:hypothetical protein